jgi:hypothetical protein
MCVIFSNTINFSTGEIYVQIYCANWQPYNLEVFCSENTKQR